MRIIFLIEVLRIFLREKSGNFSSTMLALRNENGNVSSINRTINPVNLSFDAIVPEKTVRSGKKTSGETTPAQPGMIPPGRRPAGLVRQLNYLHAWNEPVGIRKIEATGTTERHEEKKIYRHEEEGMCLIEVNIGHFIACRLSKIAYNKKVSNFQFSNL